MRTSSLVFLVISVLENGALRRSTSRDSLASTVGPLPKTTQNDLRSLTNKRGRGTDLRDKLGGGIERRRALFQDRFEAAASVRRALDPLLSLLPAAPPTRLISDGDPAYVRVLREPPYRERFRHQVHPNPRRGPKGSPRSRAARRRDAALFPNDLLHALLRHSLAHHRRETVAFGRRLNALMERFFIAAVWRNLVKDVSERHPSGTTPAMRAGITTQPWTWERVLARRQFVDQFKVPVAWLELYRREWFTPGGANSLHRLTRAF
jgi:hypothetical protein